MKDRIAHILRAKNLTATEFADQLGIQRSGVSHLLAGRNEPSLDFIMKLKETFPEYNLDWLIMGKGPITVSEPFKELPKRAPETSDIGISLENQLELDAPDFVLSDDTNHESEDQLTEHNSKVAINSKLKNIILVYEDGTFEMITPR